MRVIPAAAVATACALALPAFALDYGGGLGFRYLRLDSWTPESRRSEPQLRLDADLSLRGFVLSPYVLKWIGHVRYESTRTSGDAIDQESDNLTYRLQLASMERRNSPVTVTASASRSRTEFAVEAPSGSADTGVTTGGAYDLGLTVGAPDRPGFSVHGLHSSSSNLALDGATVEESADQLSVGMTHGAGPYSLAGRYTGSWHEGDLPNANHVLHAIGLNATANFRPKATAVTSVQHRRRIPSSTDPFNPTTEANSVAASLNWLGSEIRVTSAYNYLHNLVEAPGLEARESFGHSVTAGAERPFSPAWSGGASAGASFSRARLGSAEELSTGQAGSLLARWTGTARQRIDLLVEGGPRFGMLQPAGGGSEFGYGAFGRFRGVSPAPSARFALDYLIEYESNLSAMEGWRLRQELRANLDEVRRGEIRFRASLIASGLRQSIRPFGASATRSVTAGLAADFREYGLAIDLGLSDGAQRGLADSFLGDGLFLPASFDTHSRYAALSGRAVFLRRISLTGILRYATSYGAGLPGRREASAVLRLSTFVGRLRLSLDNAYVAGGSDSLSLRTNSFMVTLSRSFGGRL